MEFINLPILFFSVVLLLSILTSFLSSRANLPLILVFLCIGLLVSENGLGLITAFHQPKVAFFVGSLALALILLSNGYQTRIQSVKRNFAPFSILSTIGVFLTSLFFAPVAHFIGDFNWMESFLLASIISSTDAAAVFFILRSGGVSIREKIKTTLEMESGSNDPMAIFLTFACLNMIGVNVIDGWSLAVNFLTQIGIGIIGGFILGIVIKRLVNRLEFDVALYPILVICMALAGFAGVNMLHGSGFLAVYIAGIFLGNAHLKNNHQILRFQLTLTWLCQSILFLTLGCFADLWHLADYSHTAILLSLFLLFVARPCAVFLCLMFFKKRYTFLEKIFISFVGLRGATSILLALAPLVLNIPFADKIFSIVFLMVLLSLSVQGFLILPMAKWCRVVLPIVDKPADKIEIDLPDLSDSYLLSYKLTDDTPAVQGCKIPRWALPVNVKREDISYNGANIKTLKSGDRIYVFAQDEKKIALLDRLYGGGQSEDVPANMGDFIFSPDILLKDLAYLYNLKVPVKWQDKTLKGALETNFSDLEVGDRFAFGKVEIVIRKKDDDQITEVGLNLEPDKTQHAFSRLLRFKTKNHNL